MEQQPNSGVLHVTIHNRHLADPIKGARITVAEHIAPERIIATMDTDDAGQANISLSAGNDNELYKKYNVTVDLPAQNRKYTKSGLQIWKGITTNSEESLVQMDQLKFLSAVRDTQIINIPDIDLLLPEETKEYQETEYWKSTWIANVGDPFIPSYLDVNLGYPSTPYKVFRENYKKYLKIVAAKEIGANFHKEAIIANILCINSFALNRVYSEFYINKGMPFHISNSTAVDQTYTPGYNTFQNIDDVVDEYFNKYIRLGDNLYPQLTMYCSGKSGHCSNLGMPQLETNRLAKAGMTHQEILAKYFKNYEIKTALEIKGHPASYPGNPLAQGVKGAGVLTIQKFLNVIRKNYNRIPVVTEDGVFGEKTKAAVVQFQKIFEKNKVNGIADEKTWYKISEKYVMISGIAEPRSSINPLSSNLQPVVDWVPYMMPVYVPVIRYKNIRQ